MGGGLERRPKVSQLRVLLNRLLLSLHLLWPPQPANFLSAGPQAPSYFLLPKANAPRSKVNGPSEKWSELRVLRAVPEAAVWVPSAVPARVPRRPDHRAAPTRPPTYSAALSHGSSSPAQASAAGRLLTRLLLALRPRHCAQPLGGGSRCLVPPLPPRPLPLALQSGAPRAQARGTVTAGVVAGDALRDRKAARASEADVCAHTHTHTILAAGDLRGPAASRPGPQLLALGQATAHGPQLLLPPPSWKSPDAQLYTLSRSLPRSRGPQDPMRWHTGRAPAARRGRGVNLV